MAILNSRLQQLVQAESADAPLAPVLVEVDGLRDSEFVRKHVLGGVSAPTQERLIKAGTFPQPDIYLGRRPMWRASTLRTFLSDAGAKRAAGPVRMPTKRVAEQLPASRAAAPARPRKAPATSDAPVPTTPVHKPQGEPAAAG